jgi:hypothetical protein
VDSPGALLAEAGAADAAWPLMATPSDVPTARTIATTAISQRFPGDTRLKMRCFICPLLSRNLPSGSFEYEQSPGSDERASSDRTVSLIGRGGVRPSRPGRQLGAREGRLAGGKTPTDPFCRRLVPRRH